jgi:hypothetical protein
MAPNFGAEPRSATGVRQPQAWARRQLPSKRPPGHSLFPLPVLPRCPFGSSSRNRVNRVRAVRRMAVHSCASEAIDALNILYGVSEESLQESIISSSEPTAGQASVHNHIVSRVLGTFPGSVPSPTSAACELLGPNFSYGYANDCTVEPYDALRVSLPVGQSAPVPMSKYLKQHTQELVKIENILADDDVVAWRQHNEPTTSYTDVRLKHDRVLYLSFLKSLVACGILSVSRVSRGKVTPFFVTKKGGKQRLVFDCRIINQMFRRAPRVELAQAEALQKTSGQ